MSDNNKNKKIPWHQNFAWWHVILLAQVSLIINILIIANDPNGGGAGILSWIWLIGTIYGIYLFFKRSKKF